MQVQNKSIAVPLFIQELGDDRTYSTEKEIRPLTLVYIYPGSYKFAVKGGPAVHIILSDRQHTLSAIPRPEVRPTSGLKRALRPSSGSPSGSSYSSSQPTALAVARPNSNGH